MTLPKCQCTAEHMGSFYATPCTTDCLQMVYSIYTCQNWISVPNIVLNHWKIHSRSDFQDAINGILRLTNDGERATEQSNDVSLVWRYSSWVRSRPLERAYRRRFLTVLKKFEPQIVVGHRVDPKRHFLTLQRVFWAIVRQNPSTGHFICEVRGKNKRPYISLISPDAPLRPIGTNFGLRVRIVDVINCAKFYRNRLRGLVSVKSGEKIRGLIFHLFHQTLPYGRLAQILGYMFVSWT